MALVSDEVAGFISRGRVGHLGTADGKGQPHVVPFCYAFDGAAIFSAVDAKPKRATGRALKRIRNIEANPSVCVTIDDYDEDWSRLRHVIIQGRAEVLTEGPEFSRGADLLLEKYPQYRAMGLARERGVMIKVTPAQVTHWSMAR
jgi:PPOX class probable F420-dependent enzyme